MPMTELKTNVSWDKSTKNTAFIEIHTWLDDVKLSWMRLVFIITSGRERMFKYAGYYREGLTYKSIMDWSDDK